MRLRRTSRGVNGREARVVSAWVSVRGQNPFQDYPQAAEKARSTRQGHTRRRRVTANLGLLDEMEPFASPYRRRATDPRGT